MIIQFENFQITLNEVLKDDFNLSDFSGIEFTTLKLISEWFSNQDTFVFKTSGSTGKSKEIQIHRKTIEYSTQATFNRIDPNRQLSDSLLCLDPQFIGGAMVIFRALIMNHSIKVIEPSKNPLDKLNPNSNYGLASMVPLQYMNSEIDRINKINTILIGGSAINVESNRDVKSNVFASYGMTETVSHIALRRLEEGTFTTTGDTVISVDRDFSLNIFGSITNHQLLKTNDIVELISETEFKWIGRKDFIINTGGIKVNPESIERKLSSRIKSLYVVSSQPDNQLGQRIVLAIEGNQEKEIDFSNLSKYNIPKKVFFVKEIPKTSSGKIDRRRTKEMLSDLI